MAACAAVLLYNAVRPHDANANDRVGEVLRRGHIPVLAHVSLHSREGRHYLAGIRQVICQTDPKRVELVIADASNPDEKFNSQGNTPAPAVIVGGPQGQPLYFWPGDNYSPDELRKAISTALALLPR